MEWISVKDKIPEETDEYLVYDVFQICVAYYFDHARDENDKIIEGGFWVYGDNSFRIFPSHWQPLPEPPK